MEHQWPGGSVEDVFHKLAYHTSDHLILRLSWPIHVGPVMLCRSQISFLLQRFESAHDGGVRDLAPLEELFVDVAHRDRFPAPDDLHDLQLLPRQSSRFWPHTAKLVRQKPNVK